MLYNYQAQNLEVNHLKQKKNNYTVLYNCMNNSSTADYTFNSKVYHGTKEQ